MEQEGVNIMIVTETNIPKVDIKQIARHQSKYRVFATNEPSKAKKKGYGIAIFMDEAIGKHIFK